ncbi:MAG: tetratricopeptide repeat protein [Acidobacteria bacterium]|nr:tetratricopeptide repeat protein [Acidobacteriota bacterium]
MDITSLEQKAIDFAKRGDFGAEAKHVNEELAKLAPANQGAWTRLARCNIELGLLDDANVALETVLQLNPQNMIARSLLQESIRREVRLSPAGPAAKRTTRSSKTKKAGGPVAGAVRGGFGRAQFAALQQLAPSSALESLGPAVEALLMSINERPFAAKVVEARNRAGQSGSKLFRRNSFNAGGEGHLYAFHHGGRWEPQINLGFYSVSSWGRSAIRAGIGFNLMASGADRDGDSGQERIAAYYEAFQQMVSTEWRELLTDWMAGNAGFLQYADRQPAVDMLPKDAVEWLITNRNAVEQGWVFVGAWLFSDRPQDAETMDDPTKLVKWIEQTFNDLLPLWASAYRAAQ